MASSQDGLLICMTRPFIQDFAHEAWNSDKAKSDFAPLTGKTAIYVPEVLWAEKRCMVMECESLSRTLARATLMLIIRLILVIQGARVDDLKYLKEHGIDRNQVSQQLSRIFSQMVYINGFFHADPHHVRRCNDILPSHAPLLKLTLIDL
jgi:aarF domain-containing kinase